MGLAWYLRHFPHLEKESRNITGEATPDYLFYPNAAEVAAGYFPDLKIIVMLRNPTFRAYSHWNMLRKWKWEPLSFQEAIESEEERLKAEIGLIGLKANYWCENFHKFSYLARGRYAEQIIRWTNHFRTEQFLFIESEAFYRNPEVETNRVFDFLGVKEFSKDSYKNFFEGRKREMEPSTKAYLDEYFRPLNAQLYSLLGKEYDW